MLNIVIPMAGHGSRFVEAGYKDPKPLIRVLGQSMIELVVSNLRPSVPHRFIFICLVKHMRDYPMMTFLQTIAPGCMVFAVDKVTQGAACTVLLVKHVINNADPLMIANCDQYVDVDMDAYLQALETSAADGLIMTMKAHDKKWSFIGLDAENRITRVVEKDPISDEATVGIYNFRHGADFVQAAEQMIARDLRVNGEFYVAPCYNEMIGAGKTIAYHNIGSLGAGMYGLGTPDDLEAFIVLPQKPGRLAVARRGNAAAAGAPHAPRICVLSSGLDRFHKPCTDIFKKQIALSGTPVDFYGLFWQPVNIDKLGEHLQGFNKAVYWTAPQRQFDEFPDAIKYLETNVNNFLSMIWGRWVLGQQMTLHNLWDQYDIFLYCRPDVCFDRSIDLPSFIKDLEFCDIFVPVNGHWRGGLNDQVCIGNHRISEYLNLFESISLYMKQGVIVHPETMLKHHLLQRGVHIAQYPIQSFIFTDETCFHMG